MSKEISTATLGDAVKERVRKAIFDSIPDEAIENLIKNELTRMTNEPHSEYDRPRGKGDVRYKPELAKLLGEEIREQLSAKTKEAVTKYIDETYINNSKELVDAAIKELAPLFMASMMEKFAQQAVQDLRYQLNNKGIYL